MDNLFTADKARELTKINKKTLPEILESIKTMAEAGLNYSTHEILRVEKDVPEKLKELGFNVEVSENHLSITW